MNHTATDQPVADTPAPATSRTPWQVRTVATIVALLALVTSYGAIYFSFYFEDPETNLGSWVFAVGFLAINVAALVAARGLLAGRAADRRILLTYTVLGILWCIAKLVFWQETEALIFGALNVVCLALLTAPRTRRHAAA